MPTDTLFASSAYGPVMAVLRQHGIVGAPAAALAAACQVAADKLPTREALAHDTLLDDLERQKRDHAQLYEQYVTPVERLYGLIAYTIQDLRTTDPRYLADLSQLPAAWQALQDHLASYSMPQLQQLLNDSIRQGLFRSDINIQLVSIVLVQQVNVALLPGVFPSGFQSAEIFRSIFLYYIRGLCTEQGARQAAEHFARL